MVSKNTAHPYTTVCDGYVVCTWACRDSPRQPLIHTRAASNAFPRPTSRARRDRRSARDANAMLLFFSLLFLCRRRARRAASGVRTVGARARVRGPRSAARVRAPRGASARRGRGDGDGDGVGRSECGQPSRIGASRARCASRVASVAGTRVASLILKKQRARVGAWFRAGPRTRAATVMSSKVRESGECMDAKRVRAVVRWATRARGRVARGRGLIDAMRWR